MQLEVCIENIAEAELANQYSCNRIEICSALDLGGLTPSMGLIEACASINSIESHVLIRPRPGDFVYSNKEILLMKRDIQKAAEAGAKGVVFGCLDNKNGIAMENNELLLQFAKGLMLDTTFHRAIDFTANYQQAFQSVSKMGFKRVLTSGQREFAEDGYENLQLLLDDNPYQIEIMAGSGIKPSNVYLFKKLGLDAIHFSIRNKSKVNMVFSMGSANSVDEKKLKEIVQKNI